MDSDTKFPLEALFLILRNQKLTKKFEWKIVKMLFKELFSETRRVHGSQAKPVACLLKVAWSLLDWKTNTGYSVEQVFYYLFPNGNLIS